MADDRDLKILTLEAEIAALRARLARLEPTPDPIPDLQRAVLEVVQAGWPAGKPSSLGKVCWYEDISMACNQAGFVVSNRTIRSALKHLTL